MGPRWAQRTEPVASSVVVPCVVVSFLWVSLVRLAVGGQPKTVEGHMRRGTMLVLGLLLASTAMPHEVQARDLLGSMVGALTSPIRGVLGTGRHHYRGRPRSCRRNGSRRCDDHQNRTRQDFSDDRLGDQR